MYAGKQGIKGHDLYFGNPYPRTTKASVPVLPTLPKHSGVSRILGHVRPSLPTPELFKDPHENHQKCAQIVKPVLFSLGRPLIFGKILSKWHENAYFNAYFSKFSRGSMPRTPLDTASWLTPLAFPILPKINLHQVGNTAMNQKVF